MPKYKKAKLTAAQKSDKALNAVAENLYAAIQKCDFSWEKFYTAERPVNVASGCKWTNRNYLSAAIHFLKNDKKNPYYIGKGALINEAKAQNVDPKTIFVKGSKQIDIITFCPYEKTNTATGEKENKGYFSYRKAVHVEDVQNVDLSKMIEKQRAKDKSLNHDNKANKKIDTVINAFLKAKGIRVVSTLSTPYNSTVNKTIGIPPMENFESPELYYKSLVHEAIHATGAKDCLNRKTLIDYSKSRSIRAAEELVAEIGAKLFLDKFNFVCPKTDKKITSYLCSWAGDLPEGIETIKTAIVAAEQAVKYILKETETN